MVHIGTQEVRNTYNIFIRNLKLRSQLRDMGMGGRILLKWNLKKYDRGHRLDSCFLTVSFSRRILVYVIRRN
jgi:hypothetical protein